MAPARKSVGRSSQQDIIVDSIPVCARSPSKIISNFCKRSVATCAAVTGLTCPDRFAEGAAIGCPRAVISDCAIGWDGTRRAMLGRPARAKSQTEHSFEAGATIVKGPGQNFSASFKAMSER